MTIYLPNIHLLDKDAFLVENKRQLHTLHVLNSMPTPFAVVVAADGLVVNHPLRTEAGVRTIDRIKVQFTDLLT